MSKKGAAHGHGLGVDSDPEAKPCQEFVANLLYSERLASFNASWPYTKESEACTPHKLAMAGLVFTNEKDVKCFVCGTSVKDLQRHSDPWISHKTASPECALIQMGYPQQPDAYTVGQVYFLLEAAMLNHMDEDFRELDNRMRVILQSLNKKGKSELSFCLSGSDSSMDF